MEPALLRQDFVSRASQDALQRQQQRSGMLASLSSAEQQALHSKDLKRKCADGKRPRMETELRMRAGDKAAKQAEKQAEMLVVRNGDRICMCTARLHMARFDRSLLLLRACGFE